MPLWLVGDHWILNTHMNMTDLNWDDHCFVAKVLRLLPNILRVRQLRMHLKLDPLQLVSTTHPTWVPMWAVLIDC